MAIFIVSSASAVDLNQTDDIMAEESAIEEADTLEITNDDVNTILEVNDDENIILNENDDNGDILEISDDEGQLTKTYQNFTGIQDQIDAASDGDTIYINGTYYGFGTPIVIDKAIKLVGLGNTELRANTNTNLKQCAIYIDHSNVVIDNITVRNGCDQWGGGILIDCFEYVQSGGKIYRYNKLQHKNITISNCVFKDNSADGNYGYGGAICYWTEDSTIINCTFINNHCTDYGGAIYANGMNNNIINCKFTYNYISNELIDINDQEGWRGGGAIYNDCQSLRIDNCTFEENYARESYGGALRLGGAAISIQNSIFKNNLAYVAKAIYCPNVIMVCKNNTFCLEYKENPDSLFVGVTENELKASNTFNKTRIDSSVKFSAGMIYEYGTTGSIYVTVDGGSIQNDKIRVLGHSEAEIDFKNNVITVSNLGVGTYTLRVTTVPDDDHFSVDGDLKVTVKKATAVITASKIAVALKKGSLWTVSLVNSKTKKPISNMKLSVKVYTGSKSKVVNVYTDSKGEAKYQTKGLSKGTHKVVVSASDARYNFNTLTSSIRVVKQTALKFKVKKVTGVKDGDSMSITVMNKKTNKRLNGVKIQLLIQDGKNVKVITLKTMKKGKYSGVCGYATNNLGVGKHTVTIVPYDIKYKGSAKSSFTITKKHKKKPAWETRDSAK